MKFWKDNQIAGEFELPVTEIADQFMQWFDGQLGAGELRKDAALLDTGLERLLRHWLNGPDGLSSVWEAENRAMYGDESFDGLYDIVWRGLFWTGGEK